MATIYVDGKPYEVDPETHLLKACLSHGLNLPYFCWHPALGSVGACRQCAVKQYRDENDTRGKIVMSCMTPATNGTRISIDDPEAVAFRSSIIEWLMANHPHDCPVCDEGGECHLQDMTVMSGHNYRKYWFPKRTYTNQNMGPFINHEMNRCIQCYRCVRYYRDYAGGRDLHAFSSRNQTYFGRHEDGVLENEFSGNLVEVCPTGVFTDKTLKHHFTRKWDLQMAPSICTHCSLGCNITASERYGTLRRVSNRYNGDVNAYFLCDRGRFGYEFVNSTQRFKQSLVKKNGALKPTSKAEALAAAGSALKGKNRMVGIGSPRASLESNFALMTLVGKENFYLGIPESQYKQLPSILKVLREGAARTPTLQEVENADAVLVLGEDLINTAPRLGLAVRQSIRWQPLEEAKKIQIPAWHDAAVRELAQDSKGPLFIAAPLATKLDELATDTYRAPSEDIARLGFAIAHKLDSKAPEVKDLPGDVAKLAAKIAEALKGAKRPVVISGTSSGNDSVVHAAANVAWALSEMGKEAGLTFVVPEANTLGLGMMKGASIDAALSAVKSGEADTVVVLENDLYRLASKAAVDELFAKAQNVIVVDSIETATTAKATVVLPGAAFAEGDGTFVSNEGRAQRFFQVYPAEGDIQESWRWFRDLMEAANRGAEAPWIDLDEIVAALSASVSGLEEAKHAAPPATYRGPAGLKVPRQTARFSGRTAMVANVTMHEPKPPEDPDSAFNFSMEGGYAQAPPALNPYFWSPGWNSMQAVIKFQDEMTPHLRGGDPGVRLIQPSAQKSPSYYKRVPSAFQAKKGEWQAVPVFVIFGSEELSALAPAIRERISKAVATLNEKDAKALKVSDGGAIEVASSQGTFRLPVAVSTEIPAGLVALPVGWDETKGFDGPVWVKLTKVA